jgi:hypothetical protein
MYDSNGMRLNDVFYQNICLILPISVILYDNLEYSSSNNTDHGSKELPTIMKIAVQVLKYLFSDYTSAHEILRDLVTMRG